MEIKRSENDPTAFIADCKTAEDAKRAKQLEVFTFEGATYKVLTIKDGFDTGAAYSFLIIAEELVLQ